jgi:hypothetical protein
MDPLPTTTPSKTQITLLARFQDFLYARLPTSCCVCTVNSDNQAGFGDSHQPLILVTPCPSGVGLCTVNGDAFNPGASA